MTYHEPTPVDRERDKVAAKLSVWATPLTGHRRDYDELMVMAEHARFVLIGAASHGTAEFYRHRAAITRRLIVEKGFTGVAIEADPADIVRIDRYVRGASPDADAAVALGDFRRFPAWVWRNNEVRDFVEWLRGYNDAHDAGIGFCGLDELTQGRPGRIAVWAHNAQVGDARATRRVGVSDGASLGQSLRQRHSDETLLIGFSTHHGTVTTADDWDRPDHSQRLRAAVPGSFEDLFHHMRAKDFVLNLRDRPQVRYLLHRDRLARSIGVIYHPQAERHSYRAVHLPDYFDAVIHIDESHALTPLDAWPVSPQAVAASA